MHSSKLKHIVIACAQVGELAVQQEFLGEVHPAVIITVAATSHALEALLRENIPYLIIVLRTKNDDANKHNFLGVIRKNESLDNVPVFMYTAAPAKKDLLDLLKKWRNALTYLPL